MFNDEKIYKLLDNCPKNEFLTYVEKYEGADAELRGYAEKYRNALEALMPYNERIAHEPFLAYLVGMLQAYYRDLIINKKDKIMDVISAVGENYFDATTSQMVGEFKETVINYRQRYLRSKKSQLNTDRTCTPSMPSTAYDKLLPLFCELSNIEAEIIQKATHISSAPLEEIKHIQNVKIALDSMLALGIGTESYWQEYYNYLVKNRYSDVISTFKGYAYEYLLNKNILSKIAKMRELDEKKLFMTLLFSYHITREFLRDYPKKELHKIAKDIEFYLHDIDKVYAFHKKNDDLRQLFRRRKAFLPMSPVDCQGDDAELKHMELFSYDPFNSNDPYQHTYYPYIKIDNFKYNISGTHYFYIPSDSSPHTLMNIYFLKHEMNQLSEKMEEYLAKIAIKGGFSALYSVKYSDSFIEGDIDTLVYDKKTNTTLLIELKMSKLFRNYPYEDYKFIKQLRKGVTQLEKSKNYIKEHPDFIAEKLGISKEIVERMKISVVLVSNTMTGRLENAPHIHLFEYLAMFDTQINNLIRETGTSLLGREYCKEITTSSALIERITLIESFPSFKYNEL